MSDSEEETVEKQLKIIFVGEANVGKVSTLNFVIFLKRDIPYSFISLYLIFWSILPILIWFVMRKKLILQTSIIRRFCYDDFTRQYTQTLGADFYVKRVILPGHKEISVKITEIGGLEMNGPMLGNYLFNCDVCTCVKRIFWQLLIHWFSRW